MSTLTILKGTTGLNAKVDPARIKYDPNSGIGELAVAVNVDIDDTGRISRRKGFTQRVAGSFHSLFSHNGTALCVTGDALSILDAGWTTTPIRNVTVGAKMSYCPVNDKIYYTNGFETGYVFNRLSYAWTASTYVGPTTKRVLSDPPVGKFIEHYKGRIYIAQGDVLWYSEPYHYEAFNLHANFLQFEEPIRMVRAVRDGIFVSTERTIYFLAGERADQGFIKMHVAPYGAFMYSDIKLNGQLLYEQDGTPVIELSQQDEAALWITEKGVCYGGPDGRFVNITRNKVELPVSLEGCSLIIKGRYIGLIEP